MRLPLILVNFKSYAEGTGEKAVKLAKICKGLSEEHDVNISIAPQDVDIFRVSSQVKIPIFAQSVEPIEPGAHTGHELALAAKKAGAIGSLINHSENKMKAEQIRKSIEMAKKNGLKTVVCVPDIESVKQVMKFKPDFIAYEVPELIGTGKAISKERPESVRKFVKALSGTGVVPLCGAGVSTGEDVRTAIELGTKGVIVASAAVKSDNPRKTLKDLVSGLG